MITWFEVVKFLHIFMAIIAVGFNISYGIWLTRAARENQHALHVLKGIKILDDRFANPAYGLLLVTGIIMILISPIELATFWILAALGIYVVLVVLGAAAYTPTLRRQIAVMEAEGAGSATYQRLASRSRMLGIVLGVLVTIIVFLMVTQPTL